MRERSGVPARVRVPVAAGALSVLLTIIAATGTQTAVANGDTRTIRLYHAHTKETIDATYRVGGQYDPAVLKQLNWFLRDWRRDEPTTMDPRLFDAVWEVYRSAGGGNETVTVMSAYRSPETNAMLRRRSRAVAEFSQHMQGKAMDTSMPGMSMEQVREMGMRLQRGGVGYYPSAGTPFVHLDVGSVRSWPRMSYDQLVRLFPDGKTVHLPSNGQPLARYEEARAEIAALGAIAPPSSRSSGFFAWLFGGSGGASRDGEDEDAMQAPAPRIQTAGRRGRGGVQVASVQPAAYAGGSAGPAASMDDSGRDFFTQQASRGARPSTPAAPPPSAPVTPPPVAANVAPPPTPVPAPAEPARTQVASLAPVAPSEQPSLQTAAIDHPAPPRRPVDLLVLASAPLPPARPVGLASFGVAIASPSTVSAYAGIEPALRRDPISSLLDRDPTAGIRTPEKVRVVTPRAQVAALGPLTGLRAAARPQSSAADTGTVAARLDRSNFRAMTTGEPVARLTTQTSAGPTLTATRSAARTETPLLSPVASGRATTFGASATDLPTHGFASPRPVQATLTR